MTAYDGLASRPMEIPGNSQLAASCAELIRGVFGVAYPPAGGGAAPHWRLFACLEGGTRPVAALETCELRLLAEGAPCRVGALRLVCVAADRRGRGLFRTLMEHALALDLAAGRATTLLYAAEPALYRRFGFRLVQQHATIGDAPEPVPASPARELALPADQALIERLLATRTPLSRGLAVADAPGLFLDHLGESDGADDLRFAYLPDADALVAFSFAGDTLVLADVVAATLPPLEAVLGALPCRAKRLKILFPPDLLGWSGIPSRVDTGLMARGPLPAAFARPVMLPPTSEF